MKTTCKEYRDWALKELERVREKTAWVSERNKEKIPYTTDETGTYDNKADREKTFRPDDGICWWTNGFWAGILWLLYLDTGVEKYKDYARRQETLLKPAFDNFYGLHHDLGFMFLPGAVADYRITGSTEARKMALHAANLLAGRFNVAGGFIRAWNDLDGCDTRGWAIIDCMFNLSLLFWASDETKDPRYAQMAEKHASTVADAFLRKDGSLCHIVEFDPVTGVRQRSLGGQGFGHGSAWTRGQAWGLYGFANAYRHSGKEAFLEVAEKIGDYCASRIHKDGVIPCDFDQPPEPAYEDSCGACIMAGGFLELADLTKNEEKRSRYLELGFRILKQVGEHKADYSRNCEAIVQNCSAAYHHTCHHQTMVYADYFFIEGLYKLAGTGFRMW